MPEITGFSHLSLSVRDRDASVQWYSELFGFTPIAVLDKDAYLQTLMAHPSGLYVAFQQHTANGDEQFAPHRTGLDHLGFAVADAAELEAWVLHLKERGVTHSPITETPFGQVLNLRDPDDIQLELFFSPLL